MEAWFVRAFALLTVAVWARILLRLRADPGWLPDQRSSFPVRLSRRHWLTASILGIVAGLGVVAFTFILGR